MNADPLVNALKENVSLGSLTRRVGRFNDVWYERMAGELRAALASETTDAGLDCPCTGFCHTDNAPCSDTCRGKRVIHERERVALSSSGSIDAERLARAEWEVFGGARATGSTWDEQEPAHRDRMLAHMRDVAAEYARLSESHANP